jgi:hypothetical protein
LHESFIETSIPGLHAANLLEVVCAGTLEFHWLLSLYQEQAHTPLLQQLASALCRVDSSEALPNVAGSEPALFAAAVALYGTFQARDQAQLHLDLLQKRCTHPSWQHAVRVDWWLRPQSGWSWYEDMILAPGMLLASCRVTSRRCAASPTMQQLLFSGACGLVWPELVESSLQLLAQPEAALLAAAFLAALTGCAALCCAARQRPAQHLLTGCDCDA